MVVNFLLTKVQGISCLVKELPASRSRWLLSNTLTHTFKNSMDVMSCFPPLAATLTHLQKLRIFEWKKPEKAKCKRRKRETKCVKKSGEEGSETKLDDLLARRVSLWGQALGHTCS
jgi:hypothetical protein